MGNITVKMRHLGKLSRYQSTIEVLPETANLQTWVGITRRFGMIETVRQNVRVMPEASSGIFSVGERKGRKCDVGSSIAEMIVRRVVHFVRHPVLKVLWHSNLIRKNCLQGGITV